MQEAASMIRWLCSDAKGITITPWRSQLLNTWARSGLPASLPYDTSVSQSGQVQLPSKMAMASSTVAPSQMMAWHAAVMRTASSVVF